MYTWCESRYHLKSAWSWFDRWSRYTGFFASAHKELTQFQEMDRTCYGRVHLWCVIAITMYFRAVNKPISKLGLSMSPEVEAVSIQKYLIQVSKFSRPHNQFILGLIFVTQLWSPLKNTHRSIQVLKSLVFRLKMTVSTSTYYASFSYNGIPLGSLVVIQWWQWWQWWPPTQGQEGEHSTRMT